MFYDFSQDEIASISSTDSIAGVRSLEISYRDKDEYLLDLELSTPMLFYWFYSNLMVDCRKN